MIYVYFLIPFFMAALFRIRGSAFTIFGSEQLTRYLVWSLPAAFAEWFLFGSPWFMIPVYSATWFLGIIICEWGEWTSLVTFQDWIALTARGGLVTFFAGYPLNIWEYPYGIYVMISGLTMSIAYWIGLKIPSKIPNLNQGREMGELLTGFFIWSSLVIFKIANMPRIW